MPKASAQAGLEFFGGGIDGLGRRRLRAEVRECHANLVFFADCSAVGLDEPFHRREAQSEPMLRR